MNKEIEIICLENDCLGLYKYHILIYNDLNELIIDDYTHLGKLFFTVPKNKLYKIVVINKCQRKICKSIFTNASTEKIIFIFNKINLSSHPIITKLTDKYYPGLPIMKGDIDLWNI
jgi:hypothetical protein